MTTWLSFKVSSLLTIASFAFFPYENIFSNPLLFSVIVNTSLFDNSKSLLPFTNTTLLKLSR